MGKAYFGLLVPAIGYTIAIPFSYNLLVTVDECSWYLLIYTVTAYTLWNYFEYGKVSIGFIGLLVEILRRLYFKYYDDPGVAGMVLADIGIGVLQNVFISNLKLQRCLSICLKLFSYVFYALLIAVWINIDEKNYLYIVVIPKVMYVSCSVLALAGFLMTAILRSNKNLKRVGGALLTINLNNITFIASGYDGQIPGFILLLTLYLFEKHTDKYRRNHSLILLGFGYYYIAENTLFSKKCEENYEKLQFNKAYLGFPTFHPVLTVILILGNVFGSHITVLLTIFTWSYRDIDQEDQKKNDENSKKQWINVHKMYGNMLTIYLVGGICSWIMVAHEKLSLHFPDLYAPNFIYRTVKTVLMFLLVIIFSLLV